MFVLCVQDGKEALVFLHGYNCPLDYGLTRLAQLLALGNFPTHIHPFIFSWPTGGTLAYFPGMDRCRIPFHLRTRFANISHL